MVGAQVIKYMAKVESFVTPFRLYRYRPARELARELDTIRESYLYCSPFEGLNDPMEGLFASSRRLRNSDGYRDVREAIVENKARIGICSFSEVYDHELMWAHYAEEFKGICIGYSFSRLLSHLEDNVEFVRMYYDEKVPTVRHNNEPPLLVAKKILSCKNYRWLYEREWRMFAPLGRVSYRSRSCATHVYLGSRMEQGDRDAVARALEGLRITVSDMTIKKYSISFIDI